MVAEMTSLKDRDHNQNESSSFSSALRDEESEEIAPVNEDCMFKIHEKEPLGYQEGKA